MHLPTKLKNPSEKLIFTTHTLSIMKKAFIVALSVLFVSATISACKSSGPHCQAYGAIHKVKADKTERSI